MSATDLSAPAVADAGDRSPDVSRARAIAGGVLALLFVVYAVAVIQAPVDRAQGVIAKLLFLHPPLAYGAYLGFIVTGAAGALYLRSGREHLDRLAISGAEVGTVFCTLMIITGPIWGKGTWGRWWSWDPRLTVTLLLWFVYLAYILLRSFSEGGERTARVASVYGLVGVLLIPLNYFVIELFQARSMHPENLGRGSLGSGMGWPFLVANLMFFAAFVYALLLRYEVENLRAQAAAKEREEEVT